MEKKQTNPTKYVQRFIDFMSVSHEVEVLYTLKVKRYRCHVAVCVDRYCYDFIMYDKSRILTVNKWEVNKKIRNEHNLVTKKMKQIMEIEMKRHLKTKEIRFDGKYKYQELKTWEQEK